jgi:hypothetical protein
MSLPIRFDDPFLVDPFFDSFGSSILVFLSTATAAGREIFAILDSNENLSLQSPDPPGANMTVCVRATDLPKPNYRDRFVIRDSSGDEESWYPTQNISGGQRIGTWEIELTRATRRR